MQDASPSLPDDLPRGSARILTLAGFGAFSGTLLAAQIVLSRLFASTLGCYYAFALVSLALLGLGAGGLFVQLLPRLFTPARLPLQAAIAAIAASVFCLGGLLGYVALYPDLKHGSWLTSLGVFGGFFPFFLAGGTVVSLVLAHGRARFHRLYALDLGCAALGCLGALGLLALLHPAQALLYVVALLPLGAAVCFGLASGRRLLIGVTIAIALLSGLVSWRVLRDPRVADPPHTSRRGQTRIFYDSNSVSNVSVFEGRFFTWALSPRYPGPELPMVDLVIDGVGGTEIVEFDGRVEKLRTGRYAYLDHDLTALGQRLVPAVGRHLIIGPGGGVDVLQSVRAGRSDVTAVEINPLVEQVVNQRFAGFSGRPYQLPGVRAFVENGRTFVERTDETWDLISLTWVDTGGQASSMASSENYLYTVESYQRFLSRLRPGGCFAFMRALGLGGDLQIDGVRGVAVAVEALRRMGVTDPASHLVAAAVASPWFGKRAMLYVLVKQSPLSPAEVDRARAFLAENDFAALWLPGGVPTPDPIFAERAKLLAEIITARDPDRLYREAALDVAPSTDDNPFYFVERAGPNRAAGDGVTMLERNLTVLLSLVVPFLILPMVPMLWRTRRLGTGGVAALAYFALLGTGFMAIEVELFQVYALVLGSPTLALATVLCTLLLASGAGSLRSGKLAAAPTWMVAATFGALVVLLAAFAALKGPLLHALVALPLGLRVAGTVVTLAPIAWLMGQPLAAGMTLVSEREDIVLWGWALNGAFSVLASVVAVYGAIHVGFTRTFLAGVLCYAIAALCLLVIRKRPPVAA